jgi:hypothetical protein
MRRLAGLSMSVALACTAAGAQDLVPHEVQRGESLYRIAERLLEDPRRWPEVAKLNRLSRPARLQPGQRLLLPAALLKGTAVPAQVAYVRGPVLADGAALRIGDSVGEGAVLDVGAQGFVSLRLHDGSLLQLQANSRSTLLRLRDLPAAQRRNTLIELDRGRVDATVAPQPPGSRFQVKTPLATAGVRGTRFGVAVPAQAALTTADVVEGSVEVAAPAKARGPAAAVVIGAGEGAVVRPGAAPLRQALLPAPAMPALPMRVERLPGPLPIAAVPGAARYRVEVADDEAFTRVLWTADGSPPLVLDGLSDGHYQLRARAIDANGLLGLEASGRLWVKTTPVAPLAQLPRDGQVLEPGRVVIQCTDVPQARGYVLQLAAEPGFELLLRQERTGERCRFELADLPLGALHWRVASLAPEADGRLERGPFSDPSHFELRPLPPAPRADDIGADGGEVHWRTEPGYRYRVQLARDTGFATVLQDEETTSGRLKLALPTGCVPYALRLQAIDALGRRSAFSPPRLVNGGASVCSGDGSPLQRAGGELVQTER